MEMPQSGERFRGRENLRAMQEAYPIASPPTVRLRRVLVREGLWVVEGAIDYGEGPALDGRALGGHRLGHLDHVRSDVAARHRSFRPDGLDRLLLLNLGRDLHLDPAPEPLLAPPGGTSWEVLWSSEALRYGGSGTSPVETEEGWYVRLTRWGYASLAVLVRVPPALITSTPLVTR